jgi:D-alanine--poly(phosphoribitol) ligase subunit 2
MRTNGTGQIEAVTQRTLEILRDVTGDGDVLSDPDLPLYTSGLLDSLGTVSLMVAFEEAFGVTISPAEFDKDAWATPRAIVADIERRLSQVRSA